MTLTLHEHERLFFPHRPALHHLLCYHIDSCGNSQKGYNGFSIHPFMTCHFYLQAKICSRMCTGTKKMDVFPSGLSLGDIPEGYSAPPWWHQRKRGNQAKVLMVRNWTSIWDAIRSTPGASPPHLGGRARRDEYGTCIAKGQTSLTREGKIRCEVCQHPHLEQGETPPVERWFCDFFLSYRWELRIPASLL